ncbi:MAG: hypothetical protein OEL56_00270 [Nitrosopumilus sp.]|nr:hypothetical protein [Nitrosopumilus sp.]MDH3515458.1 hypothetical protein [Nitrosopumilus sp.]MDH3564242.1 hypothetical protein [Nitrosopumilus sp.]MDH5416588.1 hypothetical protein [Nitrosopumilus sp.]MDH5555605.1 hypothetical protein [Nitrosopumilus sp.]
MANPTNTYINFVYCELEDTWKQISEKDSDVDVYQAIEDNAKVNVRLFSDKKVPYYMKKGSKITIKDHMLKFNKSDFDK